MLRTWKEFTILPEVQHLTEQQKWVLYNNLQYSEYLYEKNINITEVRKYVLNNSSDRNYKYKKTDVDNNTG